MIAMFVSYSVGALCSIYIFGKFKQKKYLPGPFVTKRRRQIANIGSNIRIFVLVLPSLAGAFVLPFLILSVVFRKGSLYNETAFVIPFLASFLLFHPIFTWLPIEATPKAIVAPKPVSIMSEDDFEKADEEEEPEEKPVKEKPLIKNVKRGPRKLF